MQRAKHARGLRFLPKLAVITTVAAVSAAICYQASAQVNVYTDPVGFITLTAEGTAGPGSSPALSVLGLGMTQVPTLRGAVTSVSGTAVALPGLTAGQFNQSSEGPLYYIEDVNTNSATGGFTDDIVSNDANNVYTAFNDSGTIASGDNVKIIPHWNLASVFGATDQAGLLQGSSSSADLVLVQNPVTKAFATYYYSTASKTQSAGWKNAASGNTDQSLVPLYQDQGVSVQRKVSTNLNVQVVGAVKLYKTLVPLIGPGVNVIPNVYASSANTLATSGLYPGLKAGSSSSADQVLIHNDPAGSFATYYYSTASKTQSAGWKNAATGNTDASQTAIPLGASVVIVFQTGDNGFNWTFPAPY
ncbi:MAG TPA: hypothetical protein VMP11_07300 [Verrucomicrobiae bacterium]|nr:hypothetical protein [Verrucomicrobiae bacterium]